MANGYNPYSVATSQQGFLEGLLGAKQSQTAGEMAITKQKGEMEKDFQEQLIVAQKEQERLLEAGRKKKGIGGLLETVAPWLGLIPGVGAIAGGVLGGLTGMYGIKKDESFAKEQIGKTREAGLSDKWGGTFLGGRARDITAKTDTLLDRMIGEADVSDWDVGLRGAISGVEGAARGAIGENIGQAFSPLDELGYSVDPTYGPGFFKKLMAGMAHDTDTLFNIGDDQKIALKTIATLLASAYEEEE